VSKTTRTALLLFALAFAIRLAVGLWSGLSREPVEDERGYVEIAQSLKDGRGFEMHRWFSGLPEDRGAESVWFHESTRTAFRGPVVPLVFAPFATQDGGAARMRLVCVLLGSLGPPLLFVALRQSHLARYASLPAAAYAFWPPAIYESVKALSEPISQTLLLASVVALASQKRCGAGLSGAVSGLAVLARPAALIPASLLAFGAGSWRRALVFAVLFLAVVDVWVARNWQLHGRPLLTTNSGVTLVGGNSRAALDADPPGKWRSPERVYAGARDPPDMSLWGWSKLSEEASDRRFAADAWTWVRENPGDAARLCFWKLVRLFDPDPHSEKSDTTLKAVVGWLTLAPVLLLALFGLCAWREELPWTMLLLGTVITALIFYGDTRMRTCADPALLVFATHGGLRLFRRFRGTPVDSPSP
jgi:uncharacterized membrane protein